MSGIVLSPLIGDGMIIQRGSAFPIWSHNELSVSFLGKTYKSQKKDGKCLITLDPVVSGYGPFDMEISSKDASVTIKDIYAGDVWLCSGQSNMEMQMQRLKDDFGEEWKTDTCNLTIRQFKVSQEWDFSYMRDELGDGKWLVLSKETLHDFSAVAYFFAKNLYLKYGVPIGLIATAWGGTPVESWMSEDALLKHPKKIAEGKKHANAGYRNELTKSNSAEIGEWYANLSREDSGLAKDWKSPDTDLSLWDEMTLPGDFSQFGLTGFCGSIWLCRDFEASAEFASKEIKIWLGTIVDADTVYINGKETGNTTYRYPPRKYIPSGLIKTGKNRIAIRVTCNTGEGGVTCDKPFRIFTDNESIELSGTWKYKIGAKTKPHPEEIFFQRKPMGNFNAMIAPVLKFPLKGVIWYQGESNESNANEYEELFRLMIEDWRNKYLEDRILPFLFVQLPVFCRESDNDENARWAILRQAQEACLSIPCTGMAAALELGEWNDIHPINKKDVGYRLFLAAEKILFGVTNTSPGPMLKKESGVKGERPGKICLYFDNCGDGLTAKECFVSVIADEGQIRLPAKIEAKDCISIDVSSVKNPKKILYAWADNPRDRQLFNSESLPMLPFKIVL
ncbi:MAG: hypothetical protein FWC01_00075 [Treponema sp.]|nr:hypothetical protein [Treponema sp.]MCL2236684.1 hypothetical protein [Treponema sp.]